MAEVVSDRRTSRHTIAGIALAGLAMSVGWGFRGDYGHEAGAMVPGALVGLAVCIASGRQDWQRRAAVMGMAGAVGWAFGGQMSYGRIIGYTASSSLRDVCYGYACLFIVGGLWAGIGSAVLAMSVTRPRSYLEEFARPLAVLWLVWLVMGLSGLTDRLVDRWYLHDTDWVAATSALAVAGICAIVFSRDRSACAMIAVLAAGWWVGYLLLVALLGLHMTPPRSDNWAGCAGLFAALVACLLVKRDRAAVMTAGYGFLAGGLGFVLGDFVNMLGRAQWGPIGRYPALQGLDYWKWMEQLFGLVMGLGVGAVFLRRVRPALSCAVDDSSGTRLSTVALLFLLVVMMWSNLSKNVVGWIERNQIPASLLGIDSTWWCVAIGVLLSGVVIAAVVQHRRGRLPLAPASPLGRAQFLFLLVMWVAVVGDLARAMPGMDYRATFLVHVSFWLTAGVCSLLVVMWSDKSGIAGTGSAHACDTTWRLGRRFWVSLGLVPLFLLAVAYLTIRSHAEPLGGSQRRFPVTSTSAPVRP